MTTSTFTAFSQPVPYRSSSCTHATDLQAPWRMVVAAWGGVQLRVWQSGTYPAREDPLDPDESKQLDHPDHPQHTDHLVILRHFLALLHKVLSVTGWDARHEVNGEPALQVDCCNLSWVVHWTAKERLCQRGATRRRQQSRQTNVSVPRIDCCTKVDLPLAHCQHGASSTDFKSCWQLCGKLLTASPLAKVTNRSVIKNTSIAASKKKVGDHSGTLKENPILYGTRTLA